MQPAMDPAGRSAEYDAIEDSNIHKAPVIDAHPVADDIAKLRTELPFVAVLPIPRQAFSIAVGLNITGEIIIPAQAVLMKLSGLTPFAMSVLGAADGNTSAQSAAVGNDPMSADQLVAALETDWLYCYGVKNVSVRSFAAGNRVGARFIMRDQI